MLAQVMENTYHVPSEHDNGFRPSIGFPLGTALLMVLIFILSGIFSCFYHWEKIRSLRHAADVDLEGDNNSLAPSQPKPTNMNQSLPVLMPGDHIPKFIALPCPCQHPLPGRIIVQVQKLPSPPHPPPRVAVT